MADKQIRKGKTRRVEYYRLWAGNSGDSGTWDTDFIEIPANTPDDKIDGAIRKAAGKIKWRNGPPVIVGYYCDVGEAEEEGEDEEASRMPPDDGDPALDRLLAKAEAAGAKPEQLNEIAHELAKETTPDTTAAGDEEVQAECHSDDRIYSAEFNAVWWFEQADDSEILELAEEDWGDGYAADRVGMFMADIVPDVQKMFDYLEHYNQAQKKHIGWACTVNKDQALKWLKARRPLVYQRMPGSNASEDGGGAAFVTADEIRRQDADEFLAQQRAAFEQIGTPDQGAIKLGETTPTKPRDLHDCLQQNRLPKAAESTDRRSPLPES